MDHILLLLVMVVLEETVVLLVDLDFLLKEQLGRQLFLVLIVLLEVRLVQVVGLETQMFKLLPLLAHLLVVEEKVLQVQEQEILLLPLQYTTTEPQVEAADPMAAAAAVDGKLLARPAERVAPLEDREDNFLQLSELRQ